MITTKFHLHILTILTSH